MTSGERRVASSATTGRHITVQQFFHESANRSMVQRGFGTVTKLSVCRLKLVRIHVTRTNLLTTDDLLWPFRHICVP